LLNSNIILQPIFKASFGRLFFYKPVFTIFYYFRTNNLKTMRKNTFLILLVIFYVTITSAQNVGGYFFSQSTEAIFLWLEMFQQRLEMN